MNGKPTGTGECIDPSLRRYSSPQHASVQHQFALCHQSVALPKPRQVPCLGVGVDGELRALGGVIPG